MSSNNFLMICGSSLSDSSRIITGSSSFRLKAAQAAIEGVLVPADDAGRDLGLEAHPRDAVHLLRAP